MSPQRENRKLPAVGSTYEHKYKGKVFRMEVVRIKDKIAYRVSGTDYSSPTLAARSITGKSVNGWIFWNME